MTLSDLARDRNQLAQALTKIKSRALRFAWGLAVGLYQDILSNRIWLTLTQLTSLLLDR